MSKVKTWMKKKLGSPELRRALATQRVAKLMKLKKEDTEARAILRSRGIFKH